MTNLTDGIKCIGVAVLAVLTIFSDVSSAVANGQNVIKIAILHLDLKYADMNHNAKLIETGIELAADQGADWVMTPELALTGYRFDLEIGTDWIKFGPDKYVNQIQHLAKKYDVTVFLSHLERLKAKRQNVGETGVFNTLFVIDSSGEIIGRHRKINTIPVSESWSTAGDEATVVTVGQQKVGLLICADAWPKTHAQNLKEKGANIILSSASWAPGKYGPGDTWEKRSLETGLPLVVNNRTGLERQFDLRKSVSVLSYGGRRLMAHKSSDSQVIFIEWDSKENRLLNHSIRRERLI